MTEQPVEVTPEGLDPDPQVSYNPDRTRVLSIAERRRSSGTVRQEPTATQVNLRLSPEDAEDKAPASAPSYQLHRIVGQGGFGEVWEAEQGSLKRIVAVKRLRPDLLEGAHVDLLRTANSRIQSDFRQEAFTTGSLEHPNITPVYDFGVDADGSPLLAMKMVRGAPWHELLHLQFDETPVADYLSRHLLILKEVAQAVAFAHSRGVIHRDLKPSQVMIGEFGETLLMDWGLAVLLADTQAATDAPDPLHAKPTGIQVTNPAGTPAYMAPEQTQRSSSGLGPWTDVYLLGGILYQILTGTPPHVAESSAGAFHRAQFGHIDPPHDRAPQGRDVPRELEKLAMEALAPRIEDRLPSAKDFIRGIENFLSGATRRRESQDLLERIEARMPGAEGDYREYGELLTLIGQSNALWLENPEVPRVRESLLSSYAGAALSNGDLVLARTTAERLEDGPLRTKLLSDAAAAEAHQREQKRQRRVAQIFASVLAAGLIIGAIVFNKRTREDRDSLQEATERSDKVISFMLDDLSKRVARVDPELSLIAPVTQEALKHFESFNFANVPEERAFLIYQAYASVAMIFEGQGNADGALRTLNSQRQGVEDWIRAHGSSLEWEFRRGQVAQSLAELARLRGRSDELRQHAESGLKLVEAALVKYPGAYTLLGVQNVLRQSLGDAEGLQRRYGEALRISQEALQRQEDIVSKDPGNYDARSYLALFYNRVGYYQEELDHLPETEAAYKKSIDIYEKVSHGATSAARRKAMSDLAIAHMTLSDSQGKQGRLEDARKELESALSILDGLVQEDPADVRTISHRAIVLNRLGTLEVNLQRGEDGTHHHELALLDQKAAVSRSVDPRAASDTLLAMMSDFGRSLNEEEKSERARQVLTEAIHFAEARVEDNSATTNTLIQLSRLNGNMASLLGSDGDTIKQVECLEKSLSINRAILNADPNSNLWLREVGVLASRIGMARMEMREFDKARTAYDDGLATARKVEAASPNSIEYARDVAVAISRLADLAWQEGRTTQAVARYREARNAFEEICRRFPQAVYIQSEAALIMQRLARAEEAAGEIGSATKTTTEANRLLEILVSTKKEDGFVRSMVLSGDARLLTLAILDRDTSATNGRAETLKKSIDRFVAESPKGARNGATIGRALVVLCEARTALGSPDESIADEAEKAFLRQAAASHGGSDETTEGLGLACAARAQAREFLGHEQEAEADWMKSAEWFEALGKNGVSPTVATEAIRAYSKAGRSKAAGEIAQHLVAGGYARPDFMALLPESNTQE